MRIDVAFRRLHYCAQRRDFWGVTGEEALYYDLRHVERGPVPLVADEPFESLTGVQRDQDGRGVITSDAGRVFLFDAARQAVVRALQVPPGVCDVHWVGDGSVVAFAIANQETGWGFANLMVAGDYDPHIERFGDSSHCSIC